MEVEEYGPYLLRICRGYFRRMEDAEDAAGDAMVNVLRSIGGFRGECDIRTYLFCCARSASLTAKRDRQLWREVPIELGKRAVAGHDPEWECLWEERVEALRRAIERLPEHFRRAVECRDLEEMTLAEGAASLGISKGALNMHTHRAHVRLRRLMAEGGAA